MRAGLLLAVACACAPCAAGAGGSRELQRQPSAQLVPQPPTLRALDRRLRHDLRDVRVDDYEPSGTELAVRSVELLVLFAPVLFCAPLAYALPVFRNRVWYYMLARTLGFAGTAFIKWAQWASTRTDLFPDALCRQLGRLRADAPRHSRGHTRRLVSAAVGGPLESFFDSFEPDPVASGSVAQVHFASVRGVRVAVKVRHPKVVERIATDFTLMRGAAGLCKRLGVLSWLDLDETVRQFSAVIGAQTQLQTEARHLQLCRRNFRAWRDCVFPQPLLATPDVIVESYEEGRHVSDWTDRPVEAAPPGTPALPGPAGSPALSPEARHFVVVRGEDVYLKMLLSDNLMHADLHPGNILLDTQRRSFPVLVLVDLGMVAVLTREEQEHFLGLLHAMGNGDGRAAAKHVLAFADEQPNADPEAFANDMEALFKAKCRGYGTRPDFGEVVRGVLSAVRKSRVRVSPNYMTLIINAMCLDGMARAMEPSYNVLDAARPLLRLHERLPRFLFRLCLPLARRAKAANDARHLRRMRAGRA